MHRLFKKLMIGSIVLGFGLLAANLIVDNPYSHRMIHLAINEKVQQRTNLTVDYQSLRIQAMPPGIDLYGLSIATNVAPDQPLLTASKTKLRLSLWSLFLGEVRLGLLEGHDVAAVWPPPWDFPGFVKSRDIGLPPPDGPLTWPPVDRLPIDRVVLNNVRFFGEIPAFDGIPYAGKWVTVSTLGAHLDVRFDGLDDIDAELAIQSFDLSYGPGSLVESGMLKTELRIERGKFKTSDLEFQSERLSLIDGAIEGVLITSGLERRLEGLKINVGGEIKGDLSVLGSFLDFAETRGGVVGNARVDVSIPLGETSTLGDDISFGIEGDAKIEDGVLEGFKLFDSQARFKVTPSKLELSEIDVMIDGQSYGHAHGQILFDDELHFEFGAVPKRLRLEDLLDALGIEFRVFDTALDSPDLRIKGTGFPLKIDVDATVQATDIGLPDLAYDKVAYPEAPACRLALNLRVTSQKVDFSESDGYCFQPGAAQDALEQPASGELQPPKATTAATRLNVVGGIDLAHDTMNLAIDLPELDTAIGQYFAQVHLAGRGSGAVRVHGPLQAIVIDAQATIEQLVAVSLPLGKLTATITVKNREVLAHEASLHPAGGGLIKLKTAALKLDEQLELNFEAFADKLAPPFIAGIMQAAQPGLPLTFGFDKFYAKLSGPIQHPLAWRGKLDASLSELTYAQERILDQLNAVIISDHRGFRASKLTAHKGLLVIDGKFDYSRTSLFSFAVASASQNQLVRLGLHPKDRIAIEFGTSTSASQMPAADHLGQLPFIGAALVKAEVKGELALHGQLTGPFDHLQGVVDGRIRRLSVFGAGVPDINLKAFVKQSKLDVMFTHLGTVLEGRLSVDVAASGMPYSWYMTFNRLDVRAFGTRYFYADPRNYAYITANWEMQGSLLDWWRSTGQLAIQEIRVKYVQDVAGQTRMVNLRQQSPVRLLFSPNGWDFADDQDLNLEGRFVSLRLSLTDCKPPDRLALKLEGLVDLGIARELSTLVDTATGKLRVVAEVIGPVTDPELVVEVTDLKPPPQAAANWQPVTLGTTEARPALRNIQMRVFYAGGRLVIDSFSADKGAGTIAASGTLNLAEGLGDESRLDIALDDATFIVTAAFLKSFETQLSGNLALTGNSFPYRLAGDIDLVKARSTKDFDIRSEIINALRARSITASVVKGKPLLEFDLNINADRTINIHNRNIQLALSSHLQVRGTDAQPSITGQIDVDKGKFIYKRDFIIERGIVSFDDPVKPDPSLDILAVSEVDNYRVYFSITGRASQPIIEFAVDPPTRENGSPISKVEILVLLSRGSLPEENRSIGETQSAATSEALNLIMGQFEEPVEKLFDLSGQRVVRNIYIDTYPSTEGNPVPRLNMPLDLGEDFDFVVRTDPSSDQVAGEYNLHENINFSAIFERRHAAEESQQRGRSTEDTKLNLKFRFSFE